ncbi:Fatty acid desaturase [Phaeobacter sp. CECT 5382]|uniref:fatty acid desaturase n=1 Tax=Phaeobacter sp. CECT 5382 TaxID=1712645 RepID=UPI0006D9AFB0|nr:fatty acid desaturase [Phaeobacter sp. CECT 5382]CUH87989.1 Fatty acid desaturase [Phaeobacter sp. CECT 5382]
MSEAGSKADRKAYMPQGIEWGTFALILVCYGLWLAVLVLLPAQSLALTVICLGIVAALHSSLTHEALHGHPFRNRLINEALLFLPLTLFIPYGRFRDTHLAHHQDESLTDPYDDPETNFQDPIVWTQMCAARRLLLRLNNTLLGRMLLGPLMGQAAFMAGDWRLAWRGDTSVVRDWLLHALGLAMVIWIVLQTPTPLWALVAGAYIGLGLVKIRTFLEHRAHADCHGRTVVIEDRGPLAWLFLNNNLHVVHHLHPGVPWYALPRLYRAEKNTFLAANDGYLYRNYGQVFWRYLLRSKDPVPHPLWSSKG